MANWPYPVPTHEEFIRYVSDLLRVYGEEGLRFALQAETGKLPNRRTLYNWTERGQGRRNPNRTNLEAIERLWRQLPSPAQPREPRARWREIEDFTTRFASRWWEEALAWALRQDAELQDRHYSDQVNHAVERMKASGIKWALQGREIPITLFGDQTAPMRGVRSYVSGGGDQKTGYLVFRMYAFGGSGKNYAPHVWVSCQFIATKVNANGSYTRQQLIDKTRSIALTFRHVRYETARGNTTNEEQTKDRLRGAIEDHATTRVIGVWIV